MIMDGKLANDDFLTPNLLIFMRADRMNGIVLIYIRKVKLHFSPPN